MCCGRGRVHPAEGVASLTWGLGWLLPLLTVGGGLPCDLAPVLLVTAQGGWGGGLQPPVLQISSEQRCGELRRTLSAQEGRRGGW